MEKTRKTRSILTLMLCAVLAMTQLTGCGQQSAESQQESQTESGASGIQSEEPQAESEESQPENEELQREEPQTAESEEEEAGEPVKVRVGSLKGPTSMGILFLMDKAEKGETADSYEFQMATAADEILPLMVKGEMDIALVPANVAAVLYQKTDGGVAVIDINTLGVLYMLTGTAEIESVTDLKGKTIYLTGKGTTPEASLRYILDANGLKEGDYILEFKSEATEVAAVLAENPDAVGLLPQPFAVAAMMQNAELKTVLDLNEEWMSVVKDSEGMVTGVTVVRKEFLEEHPEAVETFLEEHAFSVTAVNEDTETGAALSVKAGIVAKEAIAMKAIPQCNITCVAGEDMKKMLSDYLEVLADFNVELVGGQLPEEDFYYLGE